jgi:hypothetical protein
MSYTVWADPWASSELTNTARFQTISFPENTILKAIRTKIVVYNDPAFTSLSAKLYSNELVSGVNTPRMLIAQSTNSHLKAEVCTLENGVKEIWFDFNFISLRAGDKYNIVISGTDYVYSDASHLAWAKAWPDPVYKDGWTCSFESLVVSPYYIYAVGRKLK